MSTKLTSMLLHPVRLFLTIPNDAGFDLPVREQQVERIPETNDSIAID